MNAIRLICFDLGRVLVRLCDTWAHAAELTGVPVPPNPLPPDVYQKVHSLVCQHEVGELSQEEFCAQAAPHFGIEPQHVDRIMNAFLIDVYPGAVELLDELKKAGYKTACLSNTNELHWQNMCDAKHPAYLPLDRFDYAFGSQTIRHRKPADQIYQHVERVTGFTGPQILFFDDIEENILAARRNRWNAELILRNHEPVKQVRSYLRKHGVV